MAINADGSPPHPSAGLDVSYSDKGFLLPRMTFLQRNAIEAPAEGLMIYCTDCNADASGALSIFQGGAWRIFNLDCTVPNPPLQGNHESSLTQITWNWTTVPIALGYKWNSTNDLSSAIDLGNETTYTESGLTCWTNYVRYVWAYNQCGHSTAMTITQSTAQIPFSPAPVEGTHASTESSVFWVWNAVSGATGYRWNDINDVSSSTDLGNVTFYTETGLNCLTNYTRYVWAYDDCGISVPTALTMTTASDPPAAPVAGNHLPSVTQIIWNWNTVSDATGYKWNTANNYSTAQNMGLNTSKTETGLICNTSYTRYVWAYSECGVSTSATLAQATNADPPASPVAGTHIPSITQVIWKWNSVPGALGYKWNTSSDYNNAVNMGLSTSKTESGLTCNTTYTRYVWAYGNCGTSAPVSLTQATLTDPPDAPTAGTHTTSPAEITWNWNAVSGAAGYKWNTTNDYGSAQDMGLNTAKTETGLTCNTAYTRYIWAYNNCGVSTPTTLAASTTFSPPATPVAGPHHAYGTYIVWNWSAVPGAEGYKWGIVDDYIAATDVGLSLLFAETGLSCNTEYTRYVWAYNNCGVSSSAIMIQSTFNGPPAAPVAGAHIAMHTEIVWTWNSTAGAEGYRWNVTNDYSSAFDIGLSTSYAESNLTCATNYTRYIWAYNGCGISSSVVLTQSTLACWTCGEPLFVNHAEGVVAPVNKTTSYVTVTNVQGEPSKCWITKNLGADQQATSLSDGTEASAGWYWQFNRAQGYKHDGSIRTPNTAWVNSINEASNWTADQDPCVIELENGWRLPTVSEWDNVIDAGGWLNWNGPYNSVLKIHAAGRLYYSDGLLGLRGAHGAYWSSTQNFSNYGQSLYFYSSSCITQIYYKSHGYSIRCIKD